MPSERIQRRIEALLDEADEAAAEPHWDRVRELADGVLRLDPENEDARAFLDAAVRDSGVLGERQSARSADSADGSGDREQRLPDAIRYSFAGGRCVVQRFLGEGGKKLVYLAHDSQSNPLDRLARGVFVGRERELDRLRETADEAFAGRGSVVMLIGEPGIGKTRTAQELETYARMRGATVAWGRSYESAGAPAYWPWTQIGRSLAPQLGVDVVVEALGGVRGELVRILPETLESPGFTEPEPIADPQAAQLQLFDSCVSYLRTCASLSPIVVVLDDLHWADKPTLLLLQHLGRELASLRALVVGTYRASELARRRPLSEALAELNRIGLQRVNLRGLTLNPDPPNPRPDSAAGTRKQVPL